MDNQKQSKLETKYLLTLPKTRIIPSPEGTSAVYVNP